MKGFNRTVTLQECLEYLVARSATPSSFGSILERQQEARDAIKGKPTRDACMHVRECPDPFKARDQAERALTEHIAVIRCLDGFCAATRDASCFRDRPALARLEKGTRDAGTLGRISTVVLRAYQERAKVYRDESSKAPAVDRKGMRTGHEARALVEVYRAAQRLAPEGYPEPAHRETDLEHAFGAGKCALACRRSAELYADCYLSLGAWVYAWNGRKVDARKRSGEKVRDIG